MFLRIDRALYHVNPTPYVECDGPREHEIVDASRAARTGGWINLTNERSGAQRRVFAAPPIEYCRLDSPPYVS